MAASTLRCCEGNGLLPAPRRAGNGYRGYPAETLERISLIRLAQNLGFNLEQIRKVLASQGILEMLDGLRNAPPGGKLRALGQRGAGRAAERLVLGDGML